jgi:hypothetical protein
MGHMNTPCPFMPSLSLVGCNGHQRLENFILVNLAYVDFHLPLNAMSPRHSRSSYTVIRNISVCNLYEILHVPCFI